MNERRQLGARDKRKLLGFTDNRQDAALQAGHFNDFLFVSLLRAATLAALRKAGGAGLGEDEIGAGRKQALGFVPATSGRRPEWMLDPEAKGVGAARRRTTLPRVLAHRVWVDQRRGWRYTNPNLEELGLLRVALRRRSTSWPPIEAAFDNAPAELRLAIRGDAPGAPCMILLDTHAQGLGGHDRMRSSDRGRRRLATLPARGCVTHGRLGQQERPRHAAALMIDAAEARRRPAFAANL